MSMSDVKHRRSELTCIFAIARNTFLEAVRQPVYALILTAASLLILFTPAMGAQIFAFEAGSGLENDAQRMVADLGLATILFSGLLLCVISTSSVISIEIENRTAALVLSKNISRMGFVAGKYFGIAGSILLASATMCMVLLLTIRAGSGWSMRAPMDWWVVVALLVGIFFSLVVATFRNYFRGRPWIGSYISTFMFSIFLIFLIFSVVDSDHRFIFAPTEAGSREPLSADNHAHAVLTYDGEVLKASLLLITSLLLISSISVAASTRLRTIGNAAWTGIFFLFGLVAEYLYGWISTLTQGSYFEWLASLWHAVIPNLEKFWMSDALIRERFIPWTYLGHCSLYAAVYILAMLLIASFLFERRDVV